MNCKITLSLLLVFLFSNCIYIQNQRLQYIHYPETPFFSGFSPGRETVNPTYSQEWCEKYCEKLNEITMSLPEECYLEIRGKMDATELSKNRQRLSFARANSIKQLLSAYGIPEDKLKAIADPEPDQYLGKDKFDPENRTVRFRIQKKL